MPSFTANPSTDRFHGEIRCNGINHKDVGTWGTCDGCGALVVKTHKGHLANVVIGGHDERRGERFQCWQLHRCNEQQAALRGLREAAELVRGYFPKGVEVEVYKGRKVPVGTVGTVRWIGEDEFNRGAQRLGLAVEGQAKLVYVTSANVRVADEVLEAARTMVEQDQARNARLGELETELNGLWNVTDEFMDSLPAGSITDEQNAMLEGMQNRRREIRAEIEQLKTERGY